VPTINNSVGVNINGEPLGNGRDGIEIRGTFNYLGDGGVGNIIANNGRNGILVSGDFSTVAQNDRIRFNSIYNNAALGIDLTADRTTPIDPDGVTQNDCLDIDNGANTLQNFPLLFAPTFDGNTLTVAGILQSESDESYTIDFYASQANDPSGFGEGQTYLGSKAVTIAANSTAAPFVFLVSGVGQGTNITATATDSEGNTSEFSCLAGQCEGFLRGIPKDANPANLVSTPCRAPIEVNVENDLPNFDESAQVCEVDTNNPATECSLRAALTVAGNRPGFDWIQFNIPGNAPHVITVTEDLPEITTNVLIDASTQSPIVSTIPRIEVRGNGTIPHGFVFGPGSEDSELSWIAVNGFSTDVLIETSNNTVRHCYLGLSADGTAGGDFNQNFNGIVVLAGGDNQISNNTISNNLVGISVEGNSAATKILDNNIGTDQLGNSAIRNSVGIELAGSSTDAEISRNVISGNSQTGILITNSSTLNRILNNTIGINKTQDAPLGNRNGINLTSGVTVNEIKDNVISGNTNSGILIDQNAHGNHIFTNKIGINLAETQRFANLVGIDIRETAASNDVYGNTISGNTNDGIALHQTANNNPIHSNKIGTDSTGAAQIRNNNGISLSDNTHDNVISENTISGNTNAGVYLTGSATGNEILDNRIGTNSGGTERISNNNGIELDDAVTVTSIKRNTISGNVNAGVLISGVVAQTLIQDNKIGTNKAGDGPISLKQRFGIHITSQSGNQFKILGNTISNHSDTGIFLDGDSDTNTISDNGIGTNLDREDSIPNKNGIIIKGNVEGTDISQNTISGNEKIGLQLTGSSNHLNVFQNKFGTNKNGDEKINYLLNDITEIGIQVNGASNNNHIYDNLVSNHKTGILIGSNDDPTTPGIAVENTVYFNIVGLNFQKTVAFPNFNGIVVAKNARNNTIGSTTIGMSNLVSGNRDIAIQVGKIPLPEVPPEDEFVQQNKFFGNIIGLGWTNDGNIARFPNGIGFRIQSAKENIIGGFYHPDSNFMAANVVVSCRDIAFYMGTEAKGNHLPFNFDGELPGVIEYLQKSRSALIPEVTAFGNGGDGIFLTDGAEGNIIGGETPEEGWVIANNAGNGIMLSPTAGKGNKIGANTIYNNTGFGIDLGGNGFTPNDPNDADSGPNNLQNYPDIVSKQIVGGELVIGFKVDSAPANSDYGANGIYVAFFKADNSGEGEKFLGFSFYTLADYNSLAPGVKTVNLGNLITLGITATDKITATATDAAGNTSEFTPTLAPTAANVSIGGRILSAAGAGIPQARISLTDTSGAVRTVTSNSFGYYKFTGVESGQTYVVSVRSKDARFDQPSRVITVADELTDLDFTAAP
jgi:parallel beta-helix repeat protein